NLAIMYNMCNIIPHPEEILDGEIMNRLATVNERVGTITGLYILDRIIAAAEQGFLFQQTSQTITNKQLMAYLLHLTSIEQHICGVQTE
ncbi:1994_t:CDS:2, partial [Gigaspora margarita]